MNEFLLGDSSFEDDTFEDDYPVNYQLSEAENAEIQIHINRREVKHFCDDISDGLLQYLNERKKLSRQRHQDVAALRYIVADSYKYRTKEECMILIRERLDRVKTGWFIFRGNSRLRTIVYEIMAIHKSPLANKLRQDLIMEMQAHKLLLKKYTAIQGDSIVELKRELSQLRLDYAALKKQGNSDVSEKSSTVHTLAAKFMGVFSK